MMRSISKFLNRCFVTSEMGKSIPLLFFINGERCEGTPSTAGVRLSTFLRESRNSSVKVGCEEGGCGACTVIGQYMKHTGEIGHLSMNSCLIPTCSCYGMNILTLEGVRELGMMKMIMESFVQNSATQCGYCTPGFEMTILEILCNMENGTYFDSTMIDEQLEELLCGNLCRCTGYRPIIDSVREVVKNLENVDRKKFLDSLFPQELVQHNTKYPPEGKSIYFESSDSSIWFRPASISDLTTIHSSLVDQGKWYSYVCGGTEVMIDTLIKHIIPCDLFATCPNRNCQSCKNSKSPSGEYNPKHYISIGHIPELYVLEEESDGLRMGSCTSLRALELFCDERLEENQLFQVISEQLKYFASPHLRNVASLGGNIMNSSPTSDMIPILVASNAVLRMLHNDGNTREISIKEFFKGYKKLEYLEDEEILESIFIPKVQENEILRSFKQSRRRHDDIAIANGAMRLKIGLYNEIEDCDFSFGCMAPTIIYSTHLKSFLMGKEFNEDIFTQSLKYLEKDISFKNNNDDLEMIPGGMPEYRQILCLSFYKKFFHSVRSKLYGDSKYSEADQKFVREKIGRGEKKFVLNKDFSVVGEDIRHMSSEGHVSGKTEFLDDTPPVFNEHYLSLVTSDIAKGKIKSINVSKALALEGVIGWVDSSDIRGVNHFGVAIMDEPVLVEKEINHFGEMIGGIVANDRTIARIASKFVQVEYIEEKPILTIEDAIKKNSFFENTERWLERGNIDELSENYENKIKFGNKDLEILEAELYCNGQNHFYLEPICCIVEPGDHKWNVSVTTQNTSDTQRDICDVLDLPYHKLVCRSERLGGAFGGKESRPAKYACVAAIAAQKFNVPIRLALDRKTDMKTGSMRHSFKCNYKAYVNKKDKTIEGIDIQMYNNAGFSTDMSPAVMERAVLLFDNFYNIENLRIKGKCCKTNRITGTAMRGFGVPQGLYFAESIFKDVSEKLLKDDSVDIREKHLYKEGDRTPYNALLENTHFSDIWGEIVEKSSYRKRKEEISMFNETSKYKKRGIYLIPVKFGVGYARVFLNQSNALVHCYRDGSVLVSHGGSEMGQGLYTKCNQVAASTLGIEISKVHTIESATDKAANASPCTSASVGTDLNAMSVQKACEEINSNLKPIKELLNYPEDASWEDVLSKAYISRVPLTGRGHYATPDIQEVDWTTGKPGIGKPYAYYTYAGACSEVEIDVLTGDCHILRTDIVFDVGKSINPGIDIGQIEGAFVQGCGWVFNEEMIFKDSNNFKWLPNEGELYSSGTGLYKIPTINDIPLELNVELLPDSNNPFAVMGSKGLGEPPLCLGLSAYFAAKSAIEDYREEHGLDMEFNLDIPASPERIRMACTDEIVNMFVEEDDNVFRAKGSY